MKNNILKSIFISLILVLGTANAWAYDLAANSYVYFEKPNSWSCVQFMIGHNGYSQPSKMSSISNTRLYYIKMSAWGGYTQTAFLDWCSTDNFGGWGAKISDRSEYQEAGNRTSVYDHNNDNALQSHNLFLSDLQLHRETTSDNFKKIINQNQTINVQGEDGNLNVSAGTVTISYKTFSTSITSVASPTATTSNGTKTVAAAFTSPITLTANANSGYEFIGWYDGSRQVSTNATYSYEVPYGEKTIAARFKAASSPVLYLKPNSNWKLDGARFAMYYWGDGKSDGWVEMIAIGDCNNEYYKAELPAGYTDFKFVRLNPTNFQLSWDNKWNETGDLTKQNYGNNCFTIKDGQWGDTNNGGTGATGDWSEYSDEYSAQVQMGVAGGTISIDKKSYSATSSLPNVKLGSTFTIDGITPNNNYKLKSCIVEMGDETYTPTTFPVEYVICGPITVTVEYASVYTVTFNKNGHGTAPDAQKVESGMTVSESSMQDADGYLFAGWYTTANCTTKFDFSTKINANKTLYAKWVAYENCVFFKNTLGWSNVYIYTFSDNAWYDQADGDNKPGVNPNVNKLEHGQMSRLGSSDIYYYVLTNTPTVNEDGGECEKWGDDSYENYCKCKCGYNYIAFSEENMGNNYTFYQTNAVYRGDRKSYMQLFIPQKDQIPDVINQTNYYNKGLWMKYNSTESGYKLPGDFNEWASDVQFICLDTEKGGYDFKIKVNLEENHSYGFKIKNDIWIWNTLDNPNKCNNEWFGNEINITEDNCTSILFYDQNSEKENYGNTMLQTGEAGQYTFNLYLGDGKVVLSVDYPVGKDSYRLAYKDNQKNFKPGHKILKSTKTEELDTVSFFVRRNESPHVKLQKFTSGKWSDVVDWQPVTVTADGVYNFVMKSRNQGASAELLMSQTHLYTGKYYIRTNSVDGGWVDFRRNDHEMTYTSYADKHEDFDHYFCKWIESGDLTYTVANDYSYCISDTLKNDSFTNEDGTLKAKASVRFGWDSQTNHLRRAYLSGSSHVTDRFLVLIGKDNNLKDKNGSPFNIGGLNANETMLEDMQNWIYQVDVKASKDTKVKLTAHYDGKVQYFAGNEEGTNEYVQLISADAQKTYPIRIIYDFKTNHLVAAWTMEGNQTINSDDILGTNMMIIRTDHNQAEQLIFNPAARKMEQVDTVYAVMSFSESFIKNDSKSINERAFYWVSFPFDVQISDVFGFGEYAEHWIMQEYDGESRAKYGLFEDSGTYWKYIYDTKTVLTRGKGYVLTLDVDKVKNSFVHNINKVSLYFPSKGNIGTITGELPTSMEVPSHECTINFSNDPDGTNKDKRDRRIYDSHWNIIGVPAFADVSQFETSSDNAPLRYSVDSLSFYYEYVPAKDDYITRLAGENKTDATHAGSHKRTFQAMYGYMVQFAGHLNWSAKSPVIPDQLAARRNSESELPEKISLSLEIAQGEEMADQTFVQLQQEGATTEFDMNLDLTKIVNSGANIYTLAGEQRIQSAGNALPMGEAIVPVGVQIAAEGEYTFRMPDGTEGMVVELVDYETNTRTNLLLSDYIVTLPKGSCENRFALHIQPQKDVVTGVESIGENGKVKTENGKPNKFLIDGKLIIRTADGIFDAQGHRL